MKKLLSTVVLGTAILTGCVEPQDGDPTAPPRDGDVGEMRVRRGDGRIETAHYVVRHGRAMWQGDLDLGPAPAQADVWSLAIRGLDNRWPDGRIDYRFDGARLTEADKTIVRAAMADYERLTPLRFHEGLEAGRPYISIQDSTDPNVSSTTGIGPDGTGAGDETNVNLWSPANQGVVLHELGHAIGLDHEAERSDRDTYIEFEASCSTSDIQFWLDGSSYELMGKYDLDSIMQYGSWAFCEQAGPGEPHLAANNCACYPIVLKGHAHDSELGFIPQPSVLSPGDVRSITRLYEPRLGTNQAGDKLGAASVRADFNHDGWTDLAVGAPGRSSSGVVYLYMGTESGLVAWKAIGETGLATPGGGDQFGAALAAGDFDGDGWPELVVGAPGKNAGGAIAAGTVFLFRGSQGGPVQGQGQLMTQSNTFAGADAFGDNYGSAFAVGDYTGDGRVDLVIGAPGRAVGGVRSGYAYVLAWNNFFNGLVNWTGVGEPGSGVTAGDQFGKALAADDFDRDGKVDLAVGAPAPFAGKAGAVYVFANSSTQVFGRVYPIYEGTTGAAAPAAGDQFGAALAVGSFDDRRYPQTAIRVRELAIGAPGKDSPTDSGRMFVFAPSHDGWGLFVGMTSVQYFGQHAIPGTDNLAGDGFGAVIAAANLDGDGFDDLIVGVPLKDVSGLADEGALEVFRGVATGAIASSAMYLENATHGRAAGDNYGSTVIAGDFDFDFLPEMVSGAPGHDASASVGNAGGFFVYAGQAGLPGASSYFDEASQSPE